MGKIVHVVVDRPIGYQHGDIVYPINYGYIPGIIAGDGEEQDAYILGVNEPIAEFDGQVVAAICRKNDCEDKLVVAPVGTVYHQGQIAEAVRFQEQYFVSTIDSLFRKSCGVIPFKQNGENREYLILLQTNNCWSFPKGHMEAGESEEETALRELLEETGLHARLIAGKKAVSVYDIPPYTRKQVVLLLAEVEGNVILQEAEVQNYQWVKAEELPAYLHPDTYRVCRELLR
jgi:8-oxo-dGTP pyrophosphatase MutT (NUDIX family)